MSTRQKTLSLFIGLALAASVFGALSDESLSDLTLAISTEGPDSYADGTPVQVGETYLLVYVPVGEEFLGVRTDGSLVNPATVKVTTSLAIEGAKCGFKPIQYPATLYPAGGTWVIVLLDTRTAAGTPGGLVVAQSEAVASATSVAGGGTSVGEMRVLAEAGSGMAAKSLTPAPADTPDPVITALEPNGASVGIRIKNFTDKASYEVQTRTDLASGTWEPAVGGKLLQAKTLGIQPGASAELPATLTVPADDTVRYFRVIVPGGK